MFENLVNLVKEHAGEAIINNPAIANENNDKAVNVAANGIMDQLKNLAGSGGGVEAITNLFKDGNVANNPVVGKISNQVASDLVSKLGINAESASGVVKNLIPMVMGQLVKKTNDPNDKSFNLQDIAGVLTGNGGLGNIAESLKGKLGGLFGN